MLKSTLIAALATAAVAFAAPAALHAEDAKPATEAAAAPGKSGHVEANGIRYYYEIHGEGEPLLLLHGGWARSTCSGRCCRRSPRAGR